MLIWIFQIGMMVHRQAIFVSAEVTGTPKFTCPYDGFFPIPGACTGDYYVCVNSSPYVAVTSNEFELNKRCGMFCMQSRKLLFRHARMVPFSTQFM